MSISEALEADLGNWEEFGAVVEYEMSGEVIEPVEVSGRSLPKHSGDCEATLTSGVKSVLEWNEKLGANIINLDGYLHDTWNEDSAREFELEDGRTFIPDWDRTKLSFHITTEEMLLAARQRGAEDGCHFAYVLGNWAYLAEKNNHVSSNSAKGFRAIFHEVREHIDVDFPENATTDEYRGGFER